MRCYFIYQCSYCLFSGLFQIVHSRFCSMRCEPPAASSFATMSSRQWTPKKRKAKLFSSVEKPVDTAVRKSRPLRLGPLFVCPVFIFRDVAPLWVPWLCFLWLGFMLSWYLKVSRDNPWSLCNPDPVIIDARNMPLRCKDTQLICLLTFPYTAVNS